MKKVTALFHRASNGRSPALEWLRALTKEDKRKIGEELMVAEFGWPLGMPVCRAIAGTPLHEIRVNLDNGRIARVLLVVSGSHMCVLHGFIKKQQKTP
ncbi:MAG: type II toxin-antitoxin system RelE/ParE family toxin, partial [Desulfovibrionaceae bacterium]